MGKNGHCGPPHLPMGTEVERRGAATTADSLNNGGSSSFHLPPLANELSPKGFFRSSGIPNAVQGGTLLWVPYLEGVSEERHLERHLRKALLGFGKQKKVPFRGLRCPPEGWYMHGGVENAFALGARGPSYSTVQESLEESPLTSEADGKKNCCVSLFPSLTMSIQQCQQFLEAP